MKKTALALASALLLLAACDSSSNNDGTAGGSGRNGAGGVGTGSGILALYASVRGCQSIAACDIDAASVAAARELLPAATVHLGGAETMPTVAGLVANMTGSELRAAMPAMLRAWSGSHALVLSGLRAHEVEPVAAMVGRPVAHRVTVEAFTSVGYCGVSTR